MSLFCSRPCAHAIICLGSDRIGADKLFIEGRWCIEQFTTDERKAISRSTAVLSGGIAIQEAVHKICLRNHQSAKDCYKESSAEQAADFNVRSSYSKVSSSVRPRLPPSLRCLYGDSEEHAQILEDQLDRGLAVDAFLASHKFSSCDFCKVGWFGSYEESPAPKHRCSVEQQLNFILMAENHPKLPACLGLNARFKFLLYSCHGTVAIYWSEWYTHACAMLFVLVHRFSGVFLCFCHLIPMLLPCYLS